MNITTIYGEVLTVESKQLFMNEPLTWIVRAPSGDAIIFAFSEEEAIEKAQKFAGNPRYARYFASANREDRLRISAYLPGETVWRNLYSHHTYSGTYKTYKAACKGQGDHI